MNYRLSPGDTPYLLFFFIFLLLFFYILSDVFDRKYWFVKSFILWLVIILVLGSAFFSAIVVRHRVAPTYMIHDIILQQEAAVYFLLHGKNPYSATYFGTPLELWHYSDKEVNPALYHFVMEPFYLVFSIPFYLVSNRLIGYWDGRMPLFFLFFTLLVLAFLSVKDREKRLSFVALLAFNPATLPYLVEGRDDIFMFSFLFASLFALSKGKNIISSIFLALSFSIKQSVWPLFPFYLSYLWFKTRNIKKLLIELLPFAATFAIIVLPFFFWNPKAFLDSTIFYLSGNATHSYPIAGYGFGKLLESFGFIKDVHSYYPFWVFQVLFCLPLLVFLLRLQRKNNTIQTMLFCYGIFLFVFWYFSRYFNNSHAGYLSLIFITAYFWQQNKDE
jgi:uncharacterized membrane protein